MTTPRAFSGNRYSENSAKLGDNLGCVLCGKAVTAADPPMVRVDTSNHIHNVWCELGADDFGCFPIGPDCLRLNPGIRRLASRLSEHS